MNWIDFNPQVDTEMKDEHPMLALSTKAFNEPAGLVIGLPMTPAASNETNLFAVKFTTAKGEVCYVLAHQPKSFACSDRDARQHAWKQGAPMIFESACEELIGTTSLCV